jgi:type IV pilus assembly protein PilA
MKSRRGFTLIELLVVIATIGLLASIIFASVKAAQTKARNAARIEFVQEFIKALQQYLAVNGHYPNTHNFGGTYIGGYNLVWVGKCAGTCYFNSLSTSVRNDTASDNSDGLGVAILPYMNLGTIPVDPTTVTLGAYGTFNTWIFYNRNSIDYPGTNVAEINWVDEGSNSQCTNATASVSSFYTAASGNGNTLCEYDLTEN